MTIAATQTHTKDLSWFAKTENWLDERGKAAWIAAMVLGFVFVWPVGLVILFYMIANKKFGMKRNGCAMRGSRHVTMPTSGNSAFDAYKAETLRRLQDEQENFEAFLERLREAKDKSEFDAFMDDRAKALDEVEDEKEDA